MKDAPQPPFFPLASEADKVNVARKAIKIADMIAEELENPNKMPKAQTLTKFNALTRLVRVMDKKEIDQVFEKLYAPQRSSDFHSKSASRRNAAWKAYRDAVAEAGTPASFETIVEWIENDKVRENEAASLIATQERALRYPTDKVLKRFRELTENKKVEEQKYLNATAITTFCSLVRRAQVDNHTAYSFYPTHAYGRLARKNALKLEEIVENIERKMKKAAKHRDSESMLTYIRALGNLGSPVILRAFEPFLEGDAPSTQFQRMAIVVAMDKLAENYARQTRAILFKIFQNTGEADEVRSAAVFQLMRTNPPAQMLQLMASMANYDKSDDVASAVKTALESAAELENDDDRQLSENAQAAIRQLRPELANSAQYSVTKMTDYVMDEMNLAYKIQASAIGSENSLAHKAMFLETVKNMGGYKNRFNQYHVMVSDLQGVMRSIRNQMNNGSNKNKNNKQQDNQPKKDNFHSLKKINKLMDIQSEVVEELEAQILGKIANTARFIVFNNETINNMPRMARRAAKALENGQQFNATKFFNQEQITIAFPLASGLPFLYTYRTPSVMNAGGEVRMSSNPSLTEGNKDDIRVPKTVEASAEVDVLYSAQTEAKIGFMSLFDNQHYFAGVQKKIQARLPLKLSVNVDLEKDNVQIRAEPMYPKEDVTLFHASQWPFVQRRNTLAAFDEETKKDNYLIQSKNPNVFDERFGAAAGMSIRVKAEYDQDFVDYARVMEYLQRHDWASLFMYATAAETNEYYKLKVQIESEKSETEAIKLNFNYESRDSFEQDNKQQNRHPKDTRGNLAQPKNTDANSKDRVQELMDNCQENIPNADITAVDASITFKGKSSNIAQYFTTFAFANSKSGNQQRLLAYFNANPAKNSQSEMCLQADYQMPNVAQLNFEDALKQHEDGQIDIVADFGAKCKNGQHVEMKMKLSQSQERRKHVADMPEAKQCRNEMKKGDYQMPACQNATYQANVYDQYTLTAQYDNLSKQFKEYAHKIYFYARHFGFDYINEEIRMDDSQQVKASLSFSPELTSCNVTMKSPRIKAQWTNIEVPEYARRLVAHPDNDILDRVAYMVTDGDYKRKL